MTKRESQIANLISTRIKKQDPRAEVILFGSHVNGSYNCTVFRNQECTKNGNKSAHFSGC